MNITLLKLNFDLEVYWLFPDQYCIGERKVFVNDLLEIDLLNVAGRDTGDECYWTFTTTPDRILLFAGDDLRDLLKYIEVSLAEGIESIDLF